MPILVLMREAWSRVKSNGGAAGYDKVKISDIVHSGVDEYLLALARELKTETYKAQPILRVYIPKSNGKLRPLGIPTVKDRIVQMCCKLVVEPIFEADLSGFFDTTPHDKFMFLVEQRITDRRILKLIRQWLKAPIFEDNKLNKNSKGTPQGGISGWDYITFAG